MKKIAILLIALLAAACEGNETPAADSVKISGSKTITAPATGLNAKVNFSASTDWTAKSSAGWVTLAPFHGEKNVNSADVTVAANTERSGRNAFVVFTAGTATDTLYVRQDGVDYLDAEPSEFKVGSGGGVYLSKISSNVEYSVQVEETAATWIKVSPSGAMPAKDATLSITVDPIDDVHGRTGRILISAQSLSAGINISQSGKEPVFSVTVANRKSPAAGESFSVPVTTNLEVSASTPAWITSTRTESGFDFTVSANTGDNIRSGTITISNSEFGKSASFTVSQKSSKSLYILAIGNSFSWDAMEYLYQILQNLGYKDIFLGNLYIGGCTLQTHANNITSNSGAYEYRTNSSGNWGSTKNFSAVTAMKERDWDYVSMQQASGSSGMPNTYEPYLTTILNSVKQNCPNAKYMWHMTWAYQGNSTHSEFSNYNKDQMTMYNGIVNCVKTKVLAHSEIDFVIPCGTAVQNLRTSFLGDNITRDGYHMSYDNGRYLTGLMWARQITGLSIADVTYKPSSYSYTDKKIAAIKEAVENAYLKPYEVTESSYPPVPIVSGDAETIISSQGYDPTKYTGLDLQLTHNGFYNSTSGTPSAITTDASNSNQFAATRIFAKSEIPNGSLIVLKYGFQYRPEGWTALNTKNASADRPVNVVAAEDNSVIVVSDSWWGKWNYRAFNIAKSGNPALDAAGQAELDDCFFIYVPKQ